MKAGRLVWLVWNLVGLCLLGSQAYGQIVDDSTTQKYGPKTTRYRLERDLFRGVDTLYSVDTSAVNAHQLDDFIHFGAERFYQDLGNLGTSAQPLYKILPMEIGTRYGLNSFDLFAFDLSKTRYFNTYSAHTRLHYLQGGQGRNFLTGSLARNINNQIGVGGAFKRLGSQRLYGISQPEERLMQHWSFEGYGSYLSKNGRFQALLAYGFMSHELKETGGIRSLPEDTVRGVLQKDSLLDFDTEQSRLGPNARNAETRNNWRLMAQYSLDKAGAAQLFYRFQRLRQLNHYWDQDSANAFFYTQPEVFRGWLQRPDTTTIQRKYTLHEHQAGFKSQVGRLFWAGWVRQRSWDYTLSYGRYSGVTSELFWGGQAAFRLSDTWQLEGKAEAGSGNQVELMAQLASSQGYGLALRQLSYAPSLVEQRFAGNHFDWDRRFDNTQATEAKGWYSLRRQKIRLRVDGLFRMLDNYVYFSPVVVPEQTRERVTISQLAVDLELPIYKSLYWQVYSAYTTFAGADVYRMPPLLAQSRLFFQNKIFRKRLFLQAGIQAHWRDAWYADAYMPEIQGYYNQFPPRPERTAAQQNNFLIDPYIVCDVFVNLGIKRAAVFLKMNNVNQGLGARGYFVTPWYPGTQRIFQFGVIWQFFD